MISTSAKALRLRPRAHLRLRLSDVVKISTLVTAIAGLQDQAAKWSEPWVHEIVRQRALFKLQLRMAVCGALWSCSAVTRAQETGP